MAEIQLTESSLIVHITGVDRLLAMDSRIEVPLAHIAEVFTPVPDAHEVFHGARMGGTNLPGLITAGRFVDRDGWAFWDVHDPDRAIAVRLHDEGYARLVIGVADPQAAVEAITAALRR